jgi:hypothetical protein
MNTVILNDEQLAFLQTLVSHDTDLLEPLVRDADLSFETSEDDFDVVALRDLMSFTANALGGHQEQRNSVYPFHGTRETHAGTFVVSCDRSLDEGPNVLTIWESGASDPTFMGWVGGSQDGKFVETPQFLAGRIADLIEWALSNESACEYVGIDMNDVEDLNEFVAALGRVAASSAPVPRKIDLPDGMPVWDIVNPDGSVEWSGTAADEIAALDRWVRETMPDMANYSDTIRHWILDGQVGSPVYRHEGVVHAVHTNYEVRVVPKQYKRVVSVRLGVTITTEPDDDNTTEQALLEAIDQIKVEGVESIDVTEVLEVMDVTA